MDMVELLRKVAIVPVIKMDCPEHAVPLARAIRRGGLSAVEITYRSDAAQESIRAIAEEVPDLFVCAGTVLTPEQAEQAVEAGARAVISPGLNLDTVRWCIAHEVPVIPGCATPTEVESALGMGLTTVKLFPAEVVGGVKMLKALYGPYRGVRFMPTGGISPQNVKEYLSQPNVIACGGSWLCPAQDMEEGNWKAITQRAKECMELVREARQGK